MSWAVSRFWCWFSVYDGGTSAFGEKAELKRWLIETRA